MMRALRRLLDFIFRRKTKTTPSNVVYLASDIHVRLGGGS